MPKQIKKACKCVTKFDKKHTNFSNFTYWMLFITASAVWLNSFNEAAAHLTFI